MKYSPHSDFVQILDHQVMAFIAKGLDHCGEDAFAELALREFELRYHSVRSYQRECRLRDMTPATVHRWQEIPAVPRFPPTGVVGQRQGTSADVGGLVATRRKMGRRYRTRSQRNIRDAAFDMQARACLFPDRERMKILVLLPPPHLAPGMVMAAGARRMIEQFGTSSSRFLVSPAGLDLQGLVRALRQAEGTTEPLALVGGTRGFDYFLKACLDGGVRFHLPPGSRICDSGGYAGRYRGCTPEEYWQKCRQVLAVEPSYCVNALWMCGSNTVYFDNCLKNLLAGGNSPRCKEGPPWTRTVVVDPTRFQRVQPGEIGLLRHYDLTNRADGVAIQFDTLGFETAEGFEILGRWDRIPGSLKYDGGAEHPGGVLLTRFTDFLMRRRLAVSLRTPTNAHQ